MRSLSLISVALILIVAFYSCHKSSVNANTTYINSITKSHKWTGYFSKGIVSPVGAGNFGLQAYNHNVADTTFPITELTYQLASIPFWSEPLKYKSTDAVARTVTYDTVIGGGTEATLVYYYAIDSMYFTYNSIVGSEYGYDDPYNVHVYFHTHN